MPSPGKAFGAFLGFVSLSALVGVLAAAVITPAVAVSSAAADTSIGVFNGLPEWIDVQPLAQSSTLYATKGGQEVPIANFYAENRVQVGWNQISDFVKNAAVATEDPHFYTEGGIDLQGTVRGALMTALHRSVQGGSSITQQYVKNILVQQCETEYIINPSASARVQAEEKQKYTNCYYDASGVDPARKLREMRYAIGLEKRYSKQDILQSYLNIALYGGRTYGIQSAAEYYFGVAASAVTLPQAATLVAMVNNPENLRIDEPNDAANGAANGYALTKVRRNYVLQRMLAAHYITQAEMDAAIATPVQPKITPAPDGCMTAQQYNAAFFCDYVQRIIEQSPIFGSTAGDRLAFLQRGGLKIYSTLNLDLQQTAQSSLSAYIPATDPNLNLGAANVSVEVGTGRVVTMVQNKPYDNTANPAPGTTSVNYNTPYAYGGSQGFQTGSSYKTFELIEWLKEGYSLNDVIDASQHTFPQSDFHESAPCADIGGSPWQVRNDDGSASSLNVYSATAQSVNTAFAMMATKLDLCGIKEDAQDLLVDGADDSANPYRANPSSVLGTNYIAPITMATAYAGLANNGVACSPIAIDKIVLASGQTHPVPTSECSTSPIDPSIAAAVINDLQGVLQSGGTAASANPGDGVPIFGKTGTTDNSVQNWLVTSTTKVAQATWVGNISGQVALRSQSFRGVGGGNVKFAITKPILQALDRVYGGSAFPAPEAQYLAQPTPTATPTPSSPATGTASGQGSAGGTGAGTFAPGQIGGGLGGAGGVPGNGAGGAPGGN